MSSIGAALLDILRKVERPGDFCVGGLRQIFMPALDVDGVGRIAFPLLPEQAGRLVAIAEAAPYGRGEETLVDRDVRRTWQISARRDRPSSRAAGKKLVRRRGMRPRLIARNAVPASRSPCHVFAFFNCSICSPTTT